MEYKYNENHPNLFCSIVCQYYVKLHPTWLSMGNASSTKQLSIILWNLRVKEQMVTKVVFVSTS